MFQTTFLNYKKNYFKKVTIVFRNRPNRFRKKNMSFIFLNKNWESQ